MRQLKITKSITSSLSETNRRREIQIAYNLKHNITPTTTNKPLGSALENLYTKKKTNEEASTRKPTKNEISQLKKEMLDSAMNLDFEKASELRDQIKKLENLLLI